MKKFLHELGQCIVWSCDGGVWWNILTVFGGRFVLIFRIFCWSGFGLVFGDGVLIELGVVMVHVFEKRPWLLYRVRCLLGSWTFPSKVVGLVWCSYSGSLVLDSHFFKGLNCFKACYKFFVWVRLGFDIFDGFLYYLNRFCIVINPRIKTSCFDGEFHEPPIIAPWWNNCIWDSVGSMDRKEIPWFFEIYLKDIWKGIKGPTEFLMFTKWAFNKSNYLLEEK